MAWWNPFKRAPARTVPERPAPRSSSSKEMEARLLRDRIVFLGTPFDDDVAHRVIAQLLFLESESPTEGIRLFINSPGGSVTAGFAICDTLEGVTPEVSTVCTGQCSGMAVLLFALGEPGQRFAMSGSHFMLTPLTGGQGLGVAPELERMRQAHAERLARATGQTVEQVLRDCEAGRRLDVRAARDYGLVDQVLERTRP